MAWLWHTAADYKYWITPASLRLRQAHHSAASGTSFENDLEMFGARERVQNGVTKLEKLGYANPTRAQFKRLRETLSEARDAAINIVHYGEELLLYHQRLAESRHARGFIAEHDILEHWERYASSDRIHVELADFLKAARDLLNGFYVLLDEDRKLLTERLDLPDDLIGDFVLARNLFSSGFDEVALLVAGRGLEGVARAVARKKGIVILKGKEGKEPAADAEFHDLIETLYRTKWSKDGRRLVDPRTRTLMHYLRTLRNSHAHPGERARLGAARETAVVVVTTAREIWADASRPRARLSNNVVKNW